MKASRLYLLLLAVATLCILVLFMWREAHSAVMIKAPDFPITGNLQTEDGVTFDAGKMIDSETNYATLQQYTCAYKSSGTQMDHVRDRIATYGYDTVALAYVPGAFAFNAQTTYLDTNSTTMDEVAIASVTALNGGINDSTTSVVVDDGSYFVASTADIANPNDGTNYKTWIIVDDEHMKITNVVSNTLTVTRGYHSTSAVSHSDGANVFTPLWNRLEARPGSGSPVRYFLDIGKTSTRVYLTETTVTQNWSDNITAGYDGLWLDLFVPQFSTAGFANGDPFPPYYWDTVNDVVHDFDSSLALCTHYIQDMKSRINTQTGTIPIMSANNVSNGYDDGGWALLDDLFQYSYENCWITNVDSNPITAWKHKSLGFWRNAADDLADASDNGRTRIIAFLGYAGAESAFLTPSNSNYEELIKFSVASYLLTIDSLGKATVFGMPLWIYEDGSANQRFRPLHYSFFSSLGEPVDSNNLDDLVIADTNDGVFKRAFERGMVVVNARAAGNSHEISLGGTYYNTENMRKVTSVTLDGGECAILNTTGIRGFIDGQISKYRVWIK